jgi:hypothetical protein
VKTRGSCRLAPVGAFVVFLAVVPVAKSQVTKPAPETQNQAPNVVYSGRVVRPNGQGMSARVRLFYYHEECGYGSRWLSETTADEKGVFRIAQPDFEIPSVCLASMAANQFYLVATQPGFAPAICLVQPDEKNECSLVMTKGRTLTCTVTEGGDKPVKGAVVRLGGTIPTRLPRDTGRSQAICQILGDVYEGATDDDGKCAFDDAPKVVSVITARHPDKGIGVCRDQEQATDVRIRLLMGMVRVHGAVTDKETGQPAAGIVVSPASAASGRLWGLFYAVSDERGRYALTLPMPLGFREAAKTIPDRQPTRRPGVVPPDRRGEIGLPGRLSGPLLIALDASPVPAYAPAWTPLPEEIGPDTQVDIALTKGTLVTGTVTNAVTGNPAPYIPVCASVMVGEKREFIFRISGPQGEYALRLDTEETTISPSPFRVGWTLTTPGRVQTVRLMGQDIANVDFSEDMARETTAILAIVGPDGKPAAQAMTPSRAGSKTDARGTIRLQQLAAGKEKRLYFVSADSSAAGVAVFTPKAGGESAAIPLKLIPARTAEITVQDMQGKLVAAIVEVQAANEAGEATCPVWPTGQAQPNSKAERKVVPGLLPDLEYRIRALTFGDVQEKFGRQPPVLWHFAAGDMNPTLVITLVPVAEQVASQPPVRTAEDFAAEKDAVARDARWVREDPVQKELVWYGIRDGFVMVDANARTVKYVRDLLGETGIVANSLAFGPDKVWMGTNKGLFAYDRKDMFWTRLAVGGKGTEVFVREVIFADGTLHVFAENAAEEGKRYGYDPKAGTWREE